MFSLGCIYPILKSYEPESFQFLNFFKFFKFLQLFNFFNFFNIEEIEELEKFFQFLQAEEPTDIPAEQPRWRSGCSPGVVPGRAVGHAWGVIADRSLSLLAEEGCM